MSEFAPLRFRFDDFKRELKTLQELGKGRFFDWSAEAIFPELDDFLGQVQRGHYFKGTRWEVKESRPLKTVATKHYEPGGGGANYVIGDVSWCWTICKSKEKPNQEFEVSGNASVRLRVRLAEHPDQTEIAMWRVECGASDSPGCFFHTQIMGHEDDGPFPHSLSVPRLPTLFVTPMAAIEFFLGELFQDTWAQHVSSDKGELGYWKSSQQKRFKQLLTWKLRQIERCQGSPWIALKHAKPMATDKLFADEGR